MKKIFFFVFICFSQVTYSQHFFSGDLFYRITEGSDSIGYIKISITDKFIVRQTVNNVSKVKYDKFVFLPDSNTMYRINSFEKKVEFERLNDITNCNTSLNFMRDSSFNENHKEKYFKEKKDTIEMYGKTIDIIFSREELIPDTSLPFRFFYKEMFFETIFMSFKNCFLQERTVNKVSTGFTNSYKITLSSKKENNAITDFKFPENYTWHAYEKKAAQYKIGK